MSDRDERPRSRPAVHGVEGLAWMAPFDRATARLPARAVSFSATDGVGRRGTLIGAASAGRAPLVVLVHDSRGGEELWTPLLPALHRAGFATFRFGLRKAGELEERIDARDVRGAIRRLRRDPGIDAAAVAVVGAGVGGSTASWMAGMPPRSPRVSAAVALSPVDGDLLVAARRGRFHPHDVLAVLGRSERGQSRFVARGPGGAGVTVRGVDVPGRGVTLLRDAGVRRLVVRWLRLRLPRARDGSRP